MQKINLLSQKTNHYLFTNKLILYFKLIFQKQFVLKGLKLKPFQKHKNFCVQQP